MFLRIYLRLSSALHISACTHTHAFGSVTQDHVFQGELVSRLALPTDISFLLSTSFCCNSIPFRSEGKSASERKLLAKSSLLLGKECKVGMLPVAMFPRAIMQIDYGGNHSSYLDAVRSNVSKLRTAERANEEKPGPWCPF